jgi:hypothetical protein
VEQLIPGDLNEDGMVDLADWALMKTGFLTDLTGLTPTQRFSTGDLNRDGAIDLLDMDLFAAAFANDNSANTVGAVPEPAEIGLVPIILMTTSIWRMRH